MQLTSGYFNVQCQCAFNDREWLDHEVGSWEEAVQMASSFTRAGKVVRILDINDQVVWASS